MFVLMNRYHSAFNIRLEPRRDMTSDTMTSDTITRLSCEMMWHSLESGLVVWLCVQTHTQRERER